MVSRTPLRVRDSAEVAALIPHLTGFVPTESLVLVSLRGRRKRIGLTSRVDLVDAEVLLEHLVAGMRLDGALACFLVVHTGLASTDDAHPRAELVAAYEERLRRSGISLEQALLVRDGRWWDYRCTLSCCPPEGRPLAHDAPVLLALAAEQALDGQVVLADRAQLVRSLAPDLPLGLASSLRLQERAAAELAARVEADPVEALQAEVEAWRSALDAHEQRPGPLVAAQAARLAVSLHLVEVRDAVLLWGTTRSSALLGLLQQVCRSTAPPDDAPVCASLAWVAYVRGNGALALVALQRALDSDPELGLARLLLRALDGQVPPQALMDVMTEIAS